MWSQSKDAWPSSFLAHYLQGGDHASLVLVPEKTSMRPNHFKSNTINGKGSANVSRAE